MGDKTVDWEQLCRDYVMRGRAHAVTSTSLDAVRHQARKEAWLNLDANELVDLAERIEMDALHRARRAQRRMVKAVDSDPAS